MKILSAVCILLLLHATLAEAQRNDKDVSVIAFGSCSRESDKEQMWEEINALQPDLWIWAGDNIYGDTHDMTVMKQKYDLQKKHPEYQKLIQRARITGTWDDHDFGINDGGKFYSKKNESKKLMLEFLDVAATSDVWRHEGVYHANTYGRGDRRVKVINLDTRFFRDTLEREYFVDSLTSKKIYRNTPNVKGDILGDAQWKWLEKELKNSDASIHILTSSIQVLSEEHRFEKWANFPASHKRLLTLINEIQPRGLIIISGDRHIAEISQRKLPNLAYPLVDFTASGLTHTWSGASEEKNKYRVGDMIIQKNFGLVSIDWSGKAPAVTLQVRGDGNKVYLEHKCQF
jgi:alkaline phosphatase D